MQVCSGFVGLCFYSLIFKCDARVITLTALKQLKRQMNIFSSCYVTSNGISTLPVVLLVDVLRGRGGRIRGRDVIRSQDVSIIPCGPIIPTSEQFLERVHLTTRKNVRSLAPLCWAEGRMADEFKI